MSKRRWLLVILALLSCVVVIIAYWIHAANKSEASMYTEDGKLIITVSMYNNSSFPQWRAYVEKQCPDVYINWENNLNAVSNVIYNAEHDDMPDIVAIRRFESDTTAELDKYLMDLSDLKITGTYKKEYLKPYQMNGKQYWLPGPGLFNGIIANKSLFLKYGADIPTDMDSFIKACRIMQKHGIVALDLDCLSPWTPTAIIQGFGIAPYFGSDSGAEWVEKFKEGDTESVDKEGFSRIADSLRTLRDNGIITNQDLGSDLTSVDSRMTSENAAMTFSTSDAEFDRSGKGNYVALPFYGANENDNAIYTYPIFSLGISKNVKHDADRQKAAEEVLEAMLSKGAQELLNNNSEGLISYNKGIDLKLSDSMKYVKSLIVRDKCFIRPLNSNTFAANSLALTALVKDKVDNEGFIRVLDQNLFKKVETVKVADSNMEADNELDKDQYCPVASVIAQTLKDGTGADYSLIDTDEATSSIYKGEYTNKDVAAVVQASPVYTGMLTGKQIRILLQSCIVYSTTFSDGNIEPMLEYPAVSGMIISMEKNGIILKVTDLKKKSLSDTGKYKLSISGNIYNAMLLDNNAMTSSFKLNDKNLMQYFTDYFKKSRSLPEPERYFDVQ